MPSLSELFEEYRGQFAATLEEDTSPNGATAEARHFIDTLRLRYQDENTLNAAQKRLLPYLTDSLKASLGSLGNAPRAEIKQLAKKALPAPPSKHRVKWKRRVWLVLQILLSAVLFSVLVEENQFLALLVFILLVAAELQMRGEGGAGALSKLLGGTEKKTEAQVIIEPARFLSSLADMLLTADKLLDEAGAITQSGGEGGQGLEDYPALLELLQDLLEAKSSGDGSYALRKARTVPAVLEQQGIHFEEYNGSNGEYFEFLPSLDPDEEDYKTITPALLKDKRVLRRGHVTEPNNS